MFHDLDSDKLFDYFADGWGLENKFFGEDFQGEFVTEVARHHFGDNVF